jgi:hypothetical protein
MHPGTTLVDATRDWPTPDSSGEKYRLVGKTQQSKSLEAKARRGELDNNPPCQDGPQDLDKCNMDGSSPGLLNPAWVEQLMGFPSGWTDFECWVTLSYQQSQQEHSPHSLEN